MCVHLSAPAGSALYQDVSPASPQTTDITDQGFQGQPSERTTVPERELANFEQRPIAAKAGLDAAQSTTVTARAMFAAALSSSAAKRAAAQAQASMQSLAPLAALRT